MRRIAILVGAVALLTLSLAPVAIAVNKQCTTLPCYGTNRGDYLIERGGDFVRDVIYARDGDDSVDARPFDRDRDVLYGQRGDDDLWANDGDGRDHTVGGPGLDVCIIDPADSSSVSCEITID